MKILLLNPPFLPKFSRSSRSPAVTKGGTIYYPYFLAYATGALEKHGFEDTVLVDAVAKNWSHKQTIDFVKSFKPDLVVIDTSTPSIYNDVDIGSRIKENLPNTHINLVGTHPTNLTGETFSLSRRIDSICRSEYDLTLVDLARAIESGKTLKTVDGLSFRNDGKIINNKPRELMTSEELDELPFVSEIYKEHLNVKDYFYASVMHPEVTILTARGCAYNCSFCNIPFKSSYRARFPENVVDEFEFIQNELPEVKEVMIEDDTFPISKERTMKICDLLLERKIKLKWSCNARVNTDFETLKKMKDAGCRLLCVGFETPVQQILENIHKRTTKEMQLEFMKNTRKVGLLVNGCFILGLPGETKETMRATVEFAKELNSDTAQFYPIMAYPGTEAYELIKKDGYLATEDFSKWLTPEGLHTTTVNRPDISSEELVRLCDEARKDYYFRLSYILPKLKQMMISPGEAKRTLMSAKTFFKYVFKGTNPGEM